MAKNKMTIEDLAERMDKGFKTVNSRIGLVEKNVNLRIGSVEKNVNSRIDSIKEDLTKKIDEDTEFLARITNLNFIKVEKKITKVHKDLKADINGIDRKVKAEVNRKDDIDLEIKEVRTRVTVLEKQVL